MRGTTLGLRITLVWFLAASWLVPVGAETAPATHRARFDYAMGSLAEGEIEGECTAQAAIFGTGLGGFEFTSLGGVLEHYTTDFQYARWRPTQNDSNANFYLHADQSQENGTIPAGPGEITWPSTGQARLFGDPWPLDQPTPTKPFHVAWEAHSMRTGRPSDNVSAGDFFVESDGVVWTYRDGVPGTNRLVELSNGSAQVRGNLTVYLEEARVTIGDGFDHQAPPRGENVTTTQNDVLGVYHVRFHHVLLRLVDASLTLDASQSQFACSDASGRLHGSLVAYNARGRVEGDRGLDFEQRELSLQGALSFRESVKPPTAGDSAATSFEGEGQFTAAGLDFVDAGVVAPSWPTLAEAGLWAVLVAGLLAGLGYVAKTLAPFYTRLQKPALLDEGSRTYLIEALRVNPWMNTAEIQRATGLGRSTVRYQLAVLARHGLVKSRPTVWGSRFAVLEGAAPPAPRDPIEELVRREAGDAPIRLSLLMKLVQEERSMSHGGAWYTIRKSAKSGALVMERRDGALWVRRAAQARETAR